jgi:hypothetical protein
MVAARARPTWAAHKMKTSTIRNPFQMFKKCFIPIPPWGPTYSSSNRVTQHACLAALLKQKAKPLRADALVTLPIPFPRRQKTMMRPIIIIPTFSQIVI